MYKRKRKPYAQLLRLALLILILISVYFFYHEVWQEEVSEPRITGLRAVEIIDGDTFDDSEGETIRLLGIDTPEAGEAFYSAATRALDSLLAGNIIRYEFDSRKRDRYERLLAYVFTSHDFVNKTLVEQGLASVYIFPKDMKNEHYRSVLIEAQNGARDQSLGIWSLEPPPPESFYVGNQNSFRFHRPTCFSIERLNDSAKIILPSRGDFFDLGYSPCRNCNP
jgi:micrococcal nuclease